LEDNSTQNCVISQLPYNWGLIFVYLQNCSAYDQASRSSSFDNKIIFPYALILTTWILQMFYSCVFRNVVTYFWIPYKKEKNTKKIKNYIRKKNQKIKGSEKRMLKCLENG
jgi:hypothetical protein